MRCTVCHRRLSRDSACADHPDAGTTGAGSSGSGVSVKPLTDAPALPGLTLVGRCGRGGFADVFEARDAGGRRLAVKVLRRAADARA